MIESYEDIAACVTYMGNVERSSFRLDSYVQIRTCGTYRRRSQPLAAFLDESRVAPHVVGMLLTVTTLVVGARSVLFLLKRIRIPEVIRVLGPPLVIGLSLLLAATVRSTTGLLPLLEPRMGIKPTTTKRTLPPREHSFSSSQPQKEKQTGRARKEKSKRERLLRFDLRKKESEGWKNHATSEDNPSPEYWPVKLL